MSSGVTHKKASLVLASAFSAIALYNPMYLECALGALVGVFVTPDADVDNYTIVNQIIKEKAGWIGEKAWRFFWSGYSKSFKHGQFASHFPIFSTFVRLFYIYFFTVLPINIIIWAFKIYPIDLLNELKWWAVVFLKPLFFFGLSSSDFIHYALDKLTKNVQ